jgi:hypothetical protein
MARSALKIDGIRCTVKSPDVRRAVRVVLEQIRKRAPDDFARLRKRVRGFVPLPTAAGTGAQAIWRPAGRARAGRRLDPNATGTIKISETCTAAVAIVAHQLGHACTRREDFDPRCASAGGDAAVADELCADYYAYRWGFGRDVSKARRDGHMAHHAPPPQSEFALGPFPDGHLRRYRVTSEFFIEFVRAEPPGDAGADSGESGVRQLLIVNREQPHLYDYAVAEFSRVPGLRIIRDRRQRPGPGAPRGTGERRHHGEVDALIRDTGSAIVSLPPKKPRA